MEAHELLEEVRALHERRDRLEMALADEMMVKRTSHKDQLDSQHRQKRLLDKYMQFSRELLQLYGRDATLRPDHNVGVSQAIKDFFDKYNKLLERPDAELEDEPIDMFSERAQAPTIESLLEPTSVAVVLPAAAAAAGDKTQGSLLAGGGGAAGAPALTTVVERLVEFTDEEGYGRYLDLTGCHEAFLQVIKKEDGKPNYLAFLSKFDKFHREMDRTLKMRPAYRRYAEAMLEYFRDFSRRARPLFDYEEMEARAQEKFAAAWASRNVAGWFNGADSASSGHSGELPAEPMVDLAVYNSVEQLMELGLDCLKRELQVRELKCGGTLEERAKRLWAVRGKRPDEIDECHRAAAAATAAAFGGNSKMGNKKRRRRELASDPRYIAALEAKLAAYTEFYEDHRQATIENVQRKQARTADERNESDDDLSDADDDDDDDDDDNASDRDDVIYNPKNLPLGWDGKPIPYWMYKLHGLNLTFTCEICGNAIYKGPKTFQRHFAEQRHAHGMKCLGIPNTAHFADITSIQEAISLWEKLKAERQRDQFQPQADEEYEDSQGNVVNRKTYEDLKRQGLL